MTIQEAIKHAREVADEKYKEGFLCYANSGNAENDKKNNECIKCARDHEQLAEWLEELQRYREIGSVDEIKQMQKYSDIVKKHNTIGQVIDFCVEYENIGTVEECRKARECQISKKSIVNWALKSVGYCQCPACGAFLLYSNKYCSECGQAILHDGVIIDEINC